MLDPFYSLLIEPFAAFGFMRRAMVAALALTISGTPLGVLLMLRRMGLMGDTLSHAVLPGVATGFIIGGLSLFWMSLGGMVAGIAVVLLAGALARGTALREDMTLAALFVIALAIGVSLVARVGSPADLLHVLFGSLLAVDDHSLLLIAGVSSVTVLALMVGWRAFALDTFDPGFLAAQSRLAGFWYYAFLTLVVLNLVAAYQAVGTMMAVGMMIVPAAAARFWSQELAGVTTAAAVIGALAAYGGLLISFHLDLPSGPSVILGAGAVFLVSVVVGPVGGLARRMIRRPHLTG